MFRTREQFMVTNLLLAAIRSSDSCFCENGMADTWSKQEFDEVATDISKQVTMWQVENCQAILDIIKSKKLEAEKQKAEAKAKKGKQ